MLVADVAGYFFAEYFVAFLEYLASQCRDVAPQIPFATVFYFYFGEAEQPAQQLFVLRLIQVAQEAINGFGEYPFLIHLNAVSALQTDLAGKGSHGLLEEAVDCTDVEG